MKSSEKLRYSIIIVDDYPFCREILERLINDILAPYKGKYEIIHANDGVEFLYYFVQHLPIICVFIDENMEYMDGSESIKILRKWESCRNLRRINVISSSAQNDEYTRKKLFDSGVDDFIKKPPEKKDIRKAFEQFGIFEKLKNE
jgi:CheY-like chemotaxis protein